MIDQIIVAVYLIITLIVGLYAGRKTKTLEDYAIGARNFSTVALLATVFASVVDAGMTTGLASSTFLIGPIFLISFLGIVLSNFGIAFLIAPKMKPFLGLLSSGDIFQKLYGKRAKTLMGVSTIIESILTSAIQIFAISEICQYFFAWPTLLASSVVCFIMILYTFRGGIKSVTATDVFQFGIMVLAIPMLCAIVLNEAGGIEKINELWHNSGLYFNSAPIEDKNNFNYLAVFISFSLPCLYPLCIQRMLMAKNTNQIKTTFFINGLLSLPFYLVVGGIGIIAFLLLPNSNPNIVLFELINTYLPTFAKGLVLSGLIAIFMSTIDSILNIGSLAVIHDVVGSLKWKLSENQEVKLMKIASIAIAIGAFITCHFFNSVMDMVFSLMVIGNSIFFPGFFFGILGVKTTKSGFWTGVCFGALTALICSYVINIFPLYSMLMAICINSFWLLMSSFLKDDFLNKIKLNFKTILPRKLQRDYYRASFLTNTIKRQDYCSIFFVCIAILSVFPFFFPSMMGNKFFDPVIVYLNIFSGSISIFMLFRELWWDKIKNIFPVLWVILLIIALPTQSTYMLLVSKLSPIWLIDLLILVPILFLVTSSYSVAISSFFGASLAICLFIKFETNLGLNEANIFGYWSVSIHFIVLTIFLALMRKKDHEIFNITRSTLAHETSRAFLAFENSAIYLDKFLPEIVGYYRQGNTNKNISESILDDLLLLPKQLEVSANRSYKLIEKIGYSYNKNFSFKKCSLYSCVRQAILDPSISPYLNKIKISEDKNGFIMADKTEIIQVLINLIENAIYAIKDKSNGYIELKIECNKMSVKDNGIGISKEDLLNIFDKSFSTKNTSGLGLYYSEKIIKKHGGILDCTSIKDQFTEFKILFPPYLHG